MPAAPTWEAVCRQPRCWPTSSGIFLQMQDRVTSIPGAVDFIRRVRAHVGAMALVTSSLRHNQELAFAKFDLAPFFDVVVTAEDVTHAKPHPEPYLTAVVRLGIPAERVPGNRGFAARHCLGMRRRLPHVGADNILRSCSAG